MCRYLSVLIRNSALKRILRGSLKFHALLDLVLPVGRNLLWMARQIIFWA